MTALQVAGLIFGGGLFLVWGWCLVESRLIQRRLERMRRESEQRLASEKGERS